MINNKNSLLWRIAMGWIYKLATKNVWGLVWKYVYNAYISGYSFSVQYNDWLL
jgi:hypothetical protein